MQQDLNDQLEAVIAKKRLKAKLERDLRAIAGQLQILSERLADVQASLEQEQVDVNQLEHTSLKSLFYTILGSREQQLEKERQELLAAQLQYQQVKRQVEYLEQDRASLRHKLAELAGVEKEYNALLAEKEQFIQSSGQPAAQELLGLTEQIAQLGRDDQELAEAIAAGNQVLTGLEQVIHSLESAEGWGAWDLLGGDLLITAIKHGRIDDARAAIYEVQSSMNRFHRELADVRTQVDLRIDISNFESFADYFFDGLIMDWVVQSKISASLDRAKQAKAKVSRAVKQLERRREQAQSQQSALKEKRVQMIEEA